MYLRLLLATLLLSTLSLRAADEAPNILWIYVDDMSDWMGCYGHTAVPTPNIDGLAEIGTKFERAYMPSPVCSTTRSALITGAMQTTNGLHRHRELIKKPLPEGVKTVPELFREAGYVTFNEAKSDYNFIWEYDQLFSPEFERPGFKSHMVGTDVSWLEQLKGKKFFGQIQLKGGKIEGETGSKYPMESRVADADVEVPPYYPDVPEFRNMIARHYEQVAQTDEQVGAIIGALKKFDLWDDTVVIFFTDHGCPLPRSKQFLYEDGAKVPLIVRFPNGQKELRSDLVSGIDISATSLALAGIEIPKNYEGRHLFAENYQPRDFVISARDICGIAPDRIRAVGTENFRYIRNHTNDRELYQSNYRDKFHSFVTLRKLNGEGELSSLQASYHDPRQRPMEELYDLKKDPHQTVNLASNPDYAAVLATHRKHLENWEEETGDQGRIPDSEEILRAVWKYGKGKCPAPEFHFLREKE